MKNWEINPATNRTKHGQRRHQILAIAGQLVASEGLEGLKLPVIARELGISTPALYRHFPSKESLVAELALRVMDEIHTVLKRAQTGRSLNGFERLGRFSGAYLELALTDPVTTALLSTFVTDPRRLVTGPASDEIWGLASRWWQDLEVCLEEIGVGSESTRELAWGLWTALQGQLGAQKFAERRGDIDIRRSSALSTFGMVAGFASHSSRDGLEEWCRAFNDGASMCESARGERKQWWEL